MASIKYLDFDVTIERVPGGYRARVQSPCGEAEHRFESPLSEIELRDFSGGVTRHRPGMRGSDTSDTVRRIKDYGGRLFENVFGGDVQMCLLNSVREARSQPEHMPLVTSRTNASRSAASTPRMLSSLSQLTAPFQPSDSALWKPVRYSTPPKPDSAPPVARRSR